jgi:hypothetical protein
VRLSSAVLIALTLMQAPPVNVLTNGDARQGDTGWTRGGTASTESLGGVPCFTVRSPGWFAQDVMLPSSAAGSYAAIVGRGQAERVNANNSITGLPYLYGMVFAADHTHVLAYWQGQLMLARSEYPGQWAAMSGVFRVPEGAATISLQLRQAERKDDPQDGSAARFTDVRMVMFSSEAAARDFVAAYRSR